MDFEVIKRRVLNTDDLSEIYFLEIDITKYIGTLHKRLNHCPRQEDRINIKSELSSFSAILQVCKDRKSDVRDTGAKLNYNFRMAARLMLKHDTYDAIMAKSHLPRKEVKLSADELKGNKLE